MGNGKSSSRREGYIDRHLPQEIRRLSNKKPNLMPKETRERKTNKTQLGGKK